MDNQEITTSALVEPATLKLAREKGFVLSEKIITSSPYPEECGGIEVVTQGVTQALLQTWLRETCGVVVEVISKANSIRYERPSYFWQLVTDTRVYVSPNFHTYNDCLDAGLYTALSLLM